MSEQGGCVDCGAPVSICDHALKRAVEPSLTFSAMCLDNERARADRLAARVAELEAANSALTLKLARVAEWAIDAGGWRLFYYAEDAPPDVFDLSDRFNPELSKRLLEVLTAWRALVAPLGGREGE